jgi:hypothetical protein
MALVLKDRVQETTTTTGTGTLTLGGAVTGYQSFSAIGNANTTYYAIYASGGSEWEVGIGTYTASGTTLSRTTVLASSNGGSLVSFSAGTKNVWCDYPAGKAVYTDTSGNVANYTITGGTINGTAIGGTTAGDGTFDILTGNTSRLGVATGTSMVASNGLSSTSTFSGTPPTDGIVVDYSTGYGRFSAFTGDGYQWYTGGVGTTKIMDITSAGALTTTGTVTANGVLLTGNLGTVTSVTGTSPVVSSGGTTPAISMPAATTSVSGYLTSTDWNTFNNKGSGTVTSVSATSPVTSSGGTTPTIAMPAATTSVSGYLTSTDWTTFNSKGSGTVTSVAASVPSFLSVSGSPVTSSGTLAITYSGTALPIANGGTGQTTASAAFNALSPVTSTGDLIIGNGTNSSTRLGIGTNTYVLTSNGTTATWAAPASGGSVAGSNTQVQYNNSGAFGASSAFTYASSTLTAPVVSASNGLVVNSATVSASYSIPSGSNAMSVGPVTVASGQSVTVASGNRWVVL